MANDRGKSIDKTHLSIDQAEERGFIHRDYIAHCLRWSHVAKYLHLGQRYKTAHILDIGCGKEVPLAKLLYSSRLIPESGSYLGIDANKLSVPAMFSTGKFPISLVSGLFPDTLDEVQREMAALGDGQLNYDVITCFEVAEHVEPSGTMSILNGIATYLDRHGMAFISTPCYDAHVGAAANHVNEMSHEAFGSMIEYAGLHIDSVFGTFASIRDYKGLLKEFNLELAFDALRNYYDSNYLATLFAPLFPKQSRNCLWRVCHRNREQIQGPYQFKYPQLKTLDSPQHSSSNQWADFIKAL